MSITKNDLKNVLKKYNAEIKSMLSLKVDKESGKGLSTNDYTTAEKSKLSGIATNANNYSHPTTSGNKHIPSGGTTNQILKWSADGTAIWSNDSNTTYGLATTTTNGLMSSVDKVKLDNSTETNTASKIVMRDSSGNFSAGIITATLNGKANTADKLYSPRSIIFDGQINGSGSFDGSKNLTINTYGGVNCSTLGQYNNVGGLNNTIYGSCSNIGGSGNTLYSGETFSFNDGTDYTITKSNNTTLIVTFGESGEDIIKLISNSTNVALTYLDSSNTIIIRNLSSDGTFRITNDGDFIEITLTGDVTNYLNSYITKLVFYQTKSNDFYPCTLLGNKNTSIGALNLTNGQYNYTSGYSNFNMGSNNITAGSFNVNVGSQNEILNYNAYNNLIIGSSNISRESYNNIFGTSNESKSSFSFICGSNNIANTGQGFIFGSSLQSSHYCEVITGRHNKVKTTNQNWNINGDAFTIGNGSSSASKSNAFRVTYSGKVYGLSAFNSTGADYAEYFEWEDENLDNEDRVGKFVTLNGDKIRLATENDDYILGVTSGNPAIIGNTSEDSWNDMYIRDKYGRLIYEDVEVEAEYKIIPAVTEKIIDENEEERIVEISPERKVCIKEAGIEKRIKLNPDYNPELEYVPRSERKEWDAIGMLGQLIVDDDGTCIVNGYCKCNNNSIATTSDIGYRVIHRIDEHTIIILFK